jgi:hypothetical protein
MHILRGMGMNSFVTYTHAMIQDVQLQWCQWWIFDSWRTEISSQAKLSNISLHKSWNTMTSYSWNYGTASH